MKLCRESFLRLSGIIVDDGSIGTAILKTIGQSVLTGNFSSTAPDWMERITGARSEKDIVVTVVLSKQ